MMAATASTSWWARVQARPRPSGSTLGGAVISWKRFVCLPSAHFTFTPANTESAKLERESSARSSASSLVVNGRRGGRKVPQSMPDQPSMALIAGNAEKRSVMPISSLIFSCTTRASLHCSVSAK